MPVKAKIEYLARTIGMLLLFIAIVFTLISDFFLLDSYLLFLFYLLPLSLWFIFFLILKVEIDYVTVHKKILQIFLLCCSILLVGISTIMIVIIKGGYDYFLYISQLISALLLIVCWNFSLTIFKMKKLLFFLSALIYATFIIIFDVLILMDLKFFFTIFSFLIALSGILLIIIAEIVMIKKGLLKYV